MANFNLVDNGVIESWVPYLTHTIDLFYVYQNQLYFCTSTHSATTIFDSTKFTNVRTILSAASNLLSVTRTLVTSAMSPYTVISTDRLLGVVTTLSPSILPITINLPLPIANRSLIIKDEINLSITAKITVTSPGGGNIDGGGARYIFNYASITLYADGTNWFII